MFCIPFFCALSAFVLLFVGTYCSFVSFESLDSDLVLNFGFWSYKSWSLVDTNNDGTIDISLDNCVLYPNDLNIDKNWKASRTFNLIAIIIGGSILMLDCFQGCMSTKRNVSFRTGSIGYLVCTLCAGLSFIILDSNLCKNNMLITKSNTAGMDFSDTCSLSQGGKSTIASTVLFFIAAVGNCLLHPAQVKKEELESVKQGGGEGDGLDEPLFTEESSVL